MHLTACTSRLMSGRRPALHEPPPMYAVGQPWLWCTAGLPAAPHVATHLWWISRGVHSGFDATDARVVSRVAARYLGT